VDGRPVRGWGPREDPRQEWGSVSSEGKLTELRKKSFRRCIQREIAKGNGAMSSASVKVTGSHKHGAAMKVRLFEIRDEKRNRPIAWACEPRGRGGAERDS